MTNKEKVIYEIERCIYYVPGVCCSCSKYREGVSCMESLLCDALKLLKTQEPIPCGKKMKAGDIMLDFYECGYCKKAIRKPWKYCPFCGKEVKWDGFDRKTLV